MGACPCLCGRSIGFVERCLAKRAVFIGSLLPVPERMREQATSSDDRDRWTRFLHRGEQFRETYLAVAHSEDTTSRDSPVEFAAFRTAADVWEAHALSAARRLRVEDPQWCAGWAGPSYQIQALHLDADRDGADAPPTRAPDPRNGNISHTHEDAGGAPGESTQRAEAVDAKTAAGRAVDEPAATCIFCDGPTDVLRYLWPDWLCRFVVPDGNARSNDTAFVERLRREVDQAVAGPCESCVNGWIQRLDDDAIACLSSMIAGKDTRLSRRQQGVLAQWAAKTAAVIERLDNPSPPPSGTAYASLRRGDVHVGTQVLIGKYDGNDRLLAHDLDFFRGRIDGIDHDLPQSTFVIGKLIMQVFVDPWRTSTPEPDEDAAHLLIPLVPSRRTINWPPTASIDDYRYDLVRQGGLDELHERGHTRSQSIRS